MSWVLLSCWLPCKIFNILMTNIYVRHISTQALYLFKFIFFASKDFPYFILFYWNKFNFFTVYRWEILNFIHYSGWFWNGNKNLMENSIWFYHTSLLEIASSNMKRKAEKMKTSDVFLLASSWWLSAGLTLDNRFYFVEGQSEK